MRRAIRFRDIRFPVGRFHSGRFLPSLALLVLAAILLAFQSRLLADTPPGRVEITCAQGQNALAAAWDAARTDPAIAKLGSGWDGERLILTGTDLFTAQRLRSALARAGLEGTEIRDYAWAQPILAQSGRLWRWAGALALVWFLVRCAAALGRYEYRRGADALEGCYLSDYLWENSVRLLAETVVLTAGIFACLILLQWLWRAQLTLPTGFLPEGSIFDGGHYRRWWTETFPAGSASAFGRRLEQMLVQSHLLAAGEAAAMLFAARLVPVVRKGIAEEGLCLF